MSPSTPAVSSPPASPLLMTVPSPDKALRLRYWRGTVSDIARDDERIARREHHIAVWRLNRAASLTPVTHRREDLQVLSVLEALAGVGALRHPIEVRVGQDPPDRYLRHGSREWSTELTELTVQDVRITLMQAVRADGSGQPPFWADLLVTGLVVGAGTKPLHDLVSNIERVKNGKQDPP
jgi:hypothetical protein